MNDLEKLMSEFESDLTFKFRDDMPSSLGGLIVDKTIFINSHVSFDRAIANLAEELGHHKTSPTYDITNYNNLINAKYEAKARRWGYRKLVPIDKLKRLISSQDEVHNYDIAEAFGIPGDIVEEAIEMYKIVGEL